MTQPEMVLLLGLDPESGRVRVGNLEFGLAGALLVELALRRRIKLEGKKVLVQGDPPPEHEVLAEALERISAARKPRSVRSWVSRLAKLKRLRHRIAEPLVRAGRLRRQKRRFLGLIPWTAYPVLDRGGRRELLERVRARLAGAMPPEGEPDLGPVLAILHGLGGLRGLLPREERRGLGRRVKELDLHGGLQQQVPEAVAEMVAAITAAAGAAAVTAAISGASSS